MTCCEHFGKGRGCLGPASVLPGQITGTDPLHTLDAFAGKEEGKDVRMHERSSQECRKHI